MSSKEYYHLKSPDQQQVLTFVTVKNVFEPAKESGQMQSGIYMSARILEILVCLTKYLRIKYSDYAPLGILWDDTITISYDYIQENTFPKDATVHIYYDTRASKYIKANNQYRSRTGGSKTAYDLDEIFDQEK